MAEKIRVLDPHGYPPKVIGKRLAIGTDMLQLHWKESGGPAVEEPTRAGFGTRLVKGLVTREFGGTIDVRFDPAGFDLTLSLPLGSLSDAVE